VEEVFARMIMISRLARYPSRCACARGLNPAEPVATMLVCFKPISRSIPTTPIRRGEPDMSEVRDNKTKSRFELDVEGAIAFANYRLAPSAVVITHTETPRELRGRGVASELVRGALELIRADGLKVVAGCGFVADYLNKHPEFTDLVG
jgi:hypothetical protein